MDLPIRLTKAMALVLLPVFFAASILCVCGSASAAGAHSKSDHSCCPDGGHGSSHDKSSPANHRSDCNHCGQAQITAGEETVVPLAHTIPVAWMVAVSSHVEEILVEAHPSASVTAPAWHPPGPLFNLNCALLL